MFAYVSDLDVYRLVDYEKAKHIDVGDIKSVSWCATNDGGVRTGNIGNDYWVLICDCFCARYLECKPNSYPKYVACDLQQ